MKRALVISFLLLMGTLSLRAQELNCRVVIDAANVELSDKSIFADMEEAIREFMNNRKWTTDIFASEERIKCNIFITVTEMPALNNFRARVQIRSARPVFNTSYESVLFNFFDEEWAFSYAQGQPLIFSDNGYNMELTSLLGFFAYCIIGMDYDSFSPQAGKPFYQKAQVVLTNAQQAGGPGWQSFGSTKSRYWILEHLNNQSFEKFRQSVYSYHRLGLDVMFENPEQARQQILNSLKLIQTVVRQIPVSALINSYMDAKSPEMINIFLEGTPEIKREAKQILVEIDPTKTDKYEEITKG